MWVMGRDLRGCPENEWVRVGVLSNVLRISYESCQYLMYDYRDMALSVASFLIVTS